MNKKLLLATMSLAALAACTNYDDFGSKTIAEETSPVQFEVLNNNQAMTRASMDGNKIVWSAEDGDLFTLYHGGELDGGVLSKCQNATYTASTGEGTATLSTPSMIKAGKAIMVWPVDTTFRITNGALSIVIPALQKNIENNIPYVSDLINIQDRVDVDPEHEPNWKIGDPNTAGYKRMYPVYMRPMASQLIVNADYAGTDEIIATLYEGENAIDPIKVTSVDLLTDATGNTKFTKEIPLKFEDPNDVVLAQWHADEVKGNAWEKVTKFGTVADGGKIEKLTTECLTGNESCKFLILPQAAIDKTTGVNKAAVVVNTIYGKVVVAEFGTPGTKYTESESTGLWYRILKSSSNGDVAYGEQKAGAPEASGENAGKYKWSSTIARGMAQTINGFSGYEATKGVVMGEPIGAAATRYVKVLLNHLDMNGLHVKSDKQLRDAARVWELIGDQNVQVLLDGNDDGEFEISQKTIQVINEINAELAEGDAHRSFTVAPCKEHACETIVITGGGDINKDLTFIEKNILETVPASADKLAAVALNAGETWKWNGTDPADDGVKQIVVGTGVSKIINRGTLVNAATATLAVYIVDGGDIVQTIDVPFENAKTGIWNITGGDLSVQFDVTNYGTVNISKGAEYHQDGENNVFTNEATTLPQRFLAADKKENIGLVNNKGVFGTVHAGRINNYGLIEHADKDAKTYISANQTEEMTFVTPFKHAVEPDECKKMGRINLPFSNKDEQNVSISAAAATGFVSVTVAAGEDAPSNGKLDLKTVGNYVNYVIIKGGVEEIIRVSEKVKYLEFNSGTTEIAWNLDIKLGDDPEPDYMGLIVLSPVNIHYGTTIHVWNNTTAGTGAVYLGAKMYVGGVFDDGAAALPSWNGYYGNTTLNAATKYITY